MLDNTSVVVWEGVDGSGKTTLMKETASKLIKLGYSVETYKTPSETATGVFAKEYGNRPSTDPFTRMLLFLANTADDSSVLKKIAAEKRPEYLFIDRYYVCSLVYGFALVSKHFGKPVDEQRFLQFFRLVEELGSGVFVKPDLIVLVEVDRETRRRRAFQKEAGSDHVFEKDDELQELVQRYYKVLEGELDGSVITVLNADSMLEAVATELAKKLTMMKRGWSDG
ncbi:MAG: hypothetical protein QW470_00110 [Candidatus Caldarchaeum sp.]